MSESAMADALLAMWKAKAPASTYVKDANSSARGEIDPLYAEGNRTGIIIQPGPFSNTDGAIRVQQDRVWNFDVIVAARYDDQSEVVKDIMDVSQALVDTTDEWWRLNGTSGVLKAKVTGGGPLEMGRLIVHPDGPLYVYRVITVRIDENVAVTESE